MIYYDNYNPLITINGKMKKLQIKLDFQCRFLYEVTENICYVN